MTSTAEYLLPPARLAIVYAQREIRGSFALLLRLDGLFADIVRKATEPLIAQMKLAWWRDSIRVAVDRRPLGEPLLTRLFELDDPVVSDAAIQLAEAWELLLGDENWSDETIRSFARQRGQAIFSGYAELARGSAPPMVAAEAWAVNDLGLRFGAKVKLVPLLDPASLPKSRIWRPLTILALSVGHVTGPRLIWHALTGR